MNASYSRMANPRGGECSLIPYSQIVTKFVFYLRLSLTLLVYVDIICEINSLEQYAVTDSAHAITGRCCLPLCDTASATHQGVVTARHGLTSGRCSKSKTRSHVKYLFIYRKTKFERQPAFWHCRYLVMCPLSSAHFKEGESSSTNLYRTLPQILLWSAKIKQSGIESVSFSGLRFDSSLMPGSNRSRQVIC